MSEETKKIADGSDKLDEIVVPTIEVRHCRSTSNIHALEGVQIWMWENYSDRDYKAQREIKCASGMLVQVKELEKPEGGALSSCVFMVTAVMHNSLVGTERSDRNKQIVG